ncbi:Bax inhibitor-1 family protein [Mycolicibacterium novocastrense]|nr:Bax inhibitor-1 family protein [Mycolicibacterium novocastrense]
MLIGAMLAGFFFQITGLQLAISAGFVLFSSACILFQTSAIIHGGERNYIMATIGLFVSLYNLFTSASCSCWASSAATTDSALNLPASAS